MLTLAQAQTILAAALAYADDHGLKPLAIALLDSRGAQKVFAAQDGTSLKRAEIALGKAHGAVAFGLGSRAIHKMALERPYFVEAVIGAALDLEQDGFLADAARKCVRRPAELLSKDVGHAAGPASDSERAIASRTAGRAE